MLVKIGKKIPPALMTLMTTQPLQSDFKGGEIVQFQNDHDEQVIGQLSEDCSTLQEMRTDLTGDYEPVGTPYDLTDWDLSGTPWTASSKSRRGSSLTLKTRPPIKKSSSI